jgi:hypothetical protein
MINPPLVSNLLEGIGSGNKSSILGGLTPYTQEATLDDSTIRRRSMVHTVANLNSIPMDPNSSILQGAYDNIKTMGDIMRVAGDRNLREQESLKMLEESVSPLALNLALPQTTTDLRDASYNIMNQKYAEAAQGREDMATERRYVEKLQGLLEIGNLAEAKMLDTLRNTPDAYSWSFQRQSDMAHMMKLLEDEMPEEKDRFFLFGLTDFLMLTIPFLETTAYSDNVDTVNVEKGGMDWLLPGQRLRNEAYAFGQILNIRDPIKRAEEMKKVAKNMAASANDFGYRNQMMEGLIRSAILTKTPNADETNAWAAVDALFAPFVIGDLISVGKGAKAASNSVVKTLKRAGLRNDAANVVRDAAARIKTKGAGATMDETATSLDDVEEAMSPSALNSTATPGDTSLAGQLTDGPEDAEVVARKLFGDNLKVERLTEDEWAEANARVKAQAKKDFGRHVHDVQFDEIKLLSGTTVRSPVVVLGTTKDSLFVSKVDAEKAMANLGLDSAVVREIPSDNGILYGIEARLPISESQFYRKISDTKPKNFIWRFLLGSRQTSSDDLYGLAELVVAKRQKIITALENYVNPLFNKLNNNNKQKLLDILVKSEKDQKWFDSKELDMLWARQTGIGDDVHEITDTNITLGNIASPMGDPEFLSQKAFLDLKDRSAAVGKQADDLFRASGEADEAAFWANAPDDVKAVMDELTAINAQIAKGPQRVDIETFLDPNTYKAQRAASATPPPTKGMVRMYHGGVPGEGGRWATSSLEDARGWAARGEGMNIQYVDIPVNDTRIFAPGEGAAEGFAPNGRFELTAEEMATARPFKQGESLFPPEHEDLWKALDAAADEVLANQTKAGEQATRSMKRAADVAQVEELRQATPHLDDFVEMFRGGVFMNEVTKINGMPSTPLFGFTSRADINALAEQVIAMDPRFGTRLNGIRMLGLPGNRYVAWQGHLAFHDNVYMQLNDMLAERGLPPLPIEDVSSIHIPVDVSKAGTARFGKVDIQTFAGEGVPSNKVLMKYGDFARQLETYTASGPAFTKRVTDANRKANKAVESARTGGSTTEDFRAMVDKAMTLVDTKYLRNAEGQVLHTNREKIMSRPMEWSEEIAGLMPQKIKQAYYTLVELSNVEHLLRNEDAYLQKAVRGFQTMTFRGAENVDGIVYRAGSIPPVPSTRVYNITDDVHYVAKTDDEVKVGQALRLTPADINRMMKKDGYIMIRLERPIDVGNRTTVQWFMGKAQDFEIKPLKFEQIGYIPGGHRGYQDKYFPKQAAVGRQGDNGELYLKSPRTFMVGTQAEVVEWTRVMEQARIIWNNTDDELRRMEQLARHLDSKPGYPGAEEFAQMVAKGEFDPDYPVEALYDREMPSDYAKLKQRGWDDLSDPEESGINSYMQTHGRMYTSPKGTRLPDWRGQDATIIDPYEMMNKALNNIAALSSLTDYKLRSIEKWVTTFGPYLDLRGIPRDASPVRIFQESVFLNDLPEAQKLKNSAEAQRDTIKRVLGWRSDVDREFEYLGRQLVSFVAGDKPGKWNKSLSRGVEWALEKNPVARARKMAFHMKLGLFNVAQFPMQISTMMAAMSLDIRAGAQAFGGFPAMRGALGLRGQALDDWANLTLERGWHKLAGFDSPEEFKEMMKAAAGSGWFDIGGAHSLVNYQGVSASMGAIGKGAVGEVIDAAGKVVRTASEKGTFFFNEAELWNRMMAWQMAWKHVRKNGLVPGTSKFNEALMTRANDMSINMSVAGAAAWQKGWASVPTQFLSYQARFLEALLGKQFTTTEKLRLLLGQGVLYGTAGIPFLAFASEMMRSAEGEAPEIGTWEGLVDRGIIDTLIWGTTGGFAGQEGADIQYGERAATGAFVTDTFRELFGMSKYGEVSFVDIMGGPLWSITKDTSKTFWDVVKSVTAESGGDTGLPLTSAAAVNLAKNISSFNNAYKAYMVWNYGQYITKTGKVALDDLPSTDAFAVFLGLAPGEYRDYVAKQDWRRNRQETVKGVSDKILEYRQRLVREVDNADAIISEQEMLRAITPPDIWIDALSDASRSKVGESIYDGLARRYEIEKQQQEVQKE